MTIYIILGCETKEYVTCFLSKDEAHKYLLAHPKCCVRHEERLSREEINKIGEGIGKEK